MPEIAEVRVVRDTLKKQILGRKIKKINVLYPKMIDVNINLLKGLTFKDIKTVGKWLIFDLDKFSLLSHLRMEGKYFYEDSKTPIEKHTHVIFSLDNSYDLRYNDTRKFGKMIICDTGDVYDLKEIKKLGLEPDNKNLNEAYLLEKLKNKNKCIKDLLLDQTIINGLGNIYANEVLFAAKISPFKKGKDITKNEAENIIKFSKEITDEAYKWGGSSIKSYTSSLGVIGSYQDFLKIHQKEGENCPSCNTIIERVKISGRSSYYCKNCQHLNNKKSIND